MNVPIAVYMVLLSGFILQGYVLLTDNVLSFSVVINDNISYFIESRKFTTLATAGYLTGHLVSSSNLLIPYDSLQGNHISSPLQGTRALQVEGRVRGIRSSFFRYPVVCCGEGQ